MRFENVFRLGGVDAERVCVCVCVCAVERISAGVGSPFGDVTIKSSMSNNMGDGLRETRKKTEVTFHVHPYVGTMFRTCQVATDVVHGDVQSRYYSDVTVASDDSQSLHHSGAIQIPGNASKTELSCAVGRGQWFRALRSTGAGAVVVKGIDRSK